MVYVDVLGDYGIENTVMVIIGSYSENHFTIYF